MATLSTKNSSRELWLDPLTSEKDADDLELDIEINN